MIEEAYCSKELYKLLREKGFEGEIHTFYDKEGYTTPVITLQMAEKWLREVHNIHIEIRFSISTENIYRYVIIHSPLKLEDIHSYPMYFHSYEQAVEEAIKESLSLIKNGK